nr:MAG TPA: hypothetical protein [Caudoviricetes sp.]
MATRIVDCCQDFTTLTSGYKNCRHLKILNTIFF